MPRSESEQPEKSSQPKQSSAEARSSSRLRRTPVAGGGTIERKEQPKKRVSRRQRDEQKTRILYGVLGISAAVIALVILFQALNQYYFIPNKTLATVNGYEIKREDYWKYRANTLVNQISQYQQYASFFQGDQQQQYLAMAQQASRQLDDVWGSTSTDATTLGQMIDDRLYLDGLESLGLMISDQDVQNFIDDRFSNPEAPLFTPTPTPTLIPQRAEWATETAVAVEASETAAALETAAASPSAAASPDAASTPSVPVAVDQGSPAPDSASPVSSPVAVDGTPAAGTPVPEATVAMGTPEPTQTPNQDQIRETATANFDSYSDQVFDLTHMSRDDYVRLVAEPALARELVQGYFAEQVGQSAEQVEARHILVGTKELADKLAAELQADPSRFEQLAQENSIDTSTAPTGGNLGWFPRGVMVEPFEHVAFDLPPGEISDPVQTQFGWHIIQVLDHQQDRALTDEQISQSVTAQVDRWLADQRAAASISSVAKPTPTPAIEQFVPPADAPTEPESTPVPVASPHVAGSPEASPVGD